MPGCVERGLVQQIVPAGLQESRGGDAAGLVEVQFELDGAGPTAALRDLGIGRFLVAAGRDRLTIRDALRPAAIADSVTGGGGARGGARRVGGTRRRVGGFGRRRASARGGAEVDGRGGAGDGCECRKRAKVGGAAVGVDNGGRRQNRRRLKLARRGGVEFFLRLGRGVGGVKRPRGVAQLPRAGTIPAGPF